MEEIVNKYTSKTFEDIKHIDEYGNEYWFARDLQKVLEYKDWRNFLKVLDKAKESCYNSIVNVDEQLVEVNKLSKRNNNAIVNIQVNHNLIELYFRLGKILYDNYEYGNKFIDEVARELKLEYPNATGYSVRNLKCMKKFYTEYKDDKVMQQLVAQVPWGHNVVLMDKVKDKEIRKIYLQGIIENGWVIKMNENQDKGLHKSVINCLIPIYLTPPRNPYK